MRVTVEIWPGGDHLRPRSMAIVEIANISDLAEVSDYSVIATLNPGQPDQKTVHGSVKRHERSKGWGVLVERVMCLLVPGTTPSRVSQPSSNFSENKT